MTREEILPIAKPILFNTDMVKAVLDGKKTATRRKAEFLKGEIPNWTGYAKDGLMLYNGTNEPCIRKPRYRIGDYLYVRETWCNVNKPGIEPDYYYFADTRICEDYMPSEWTWRPSIHMPKQAARIFLRVTDVRVERLRDITDQDAMREGFDGIPCSCRGISHCTDCMGSGWIEPPTVGFMYTWDSTISKKDHDKYCWYSNPWVWVIQFERVEVQ